MGYSENKTIPNLTDTQKAYTMPNGEFVVVDVAQSDQPGSRWNATPQPHLAVRMRVWQVNADGTPVKDSNGVVVGPPDLTHTIVTAAMANGSVSLQNQLTTYATDALDRMANWLAVQPQISALMDAWSKSSSNANANASTNNGKSS